MKQPESSQLTGWNDENALYEQWKYYTTMKGFEHRTRRYCLLCTIVNGNDDDHEKVQQQ